MTDVEQAVRRYIVGEIMRTRDESSLEIDHPLLDEGVIDSMDLQRLVAFLEEEYDVTVPDDRMLPANFSDVRSIARLVAELRSGA